MFTMLVGLPGSGKSTFIKAYKGVIVSTDAIREELFGSEDDQTANARVFDVALKRVIAAIKEGEDVVLDATNVVSKRRISFLKQLPYCKKRALVIATPYDECLKRNAARDRKVPEEVIKRMYMSFDMPAEYEGFDEVRIFYTSDFTFNPMDLVESYKAVEHENPHHTLSVGDHMLTAYYYLLMNFHNADYVTKMAVLCHDIGKPFAKTYVNSKGEVTDKAHFYAHPHCGAYDSLFIEGLKQDEHKDVALLIQYHMNFYEIWDNEEIRKRDEDRLGARLLEKLKILHDCDLNAH